MIGVHTENPLLMSNSLYPFTCLGYPQICGIFDFCGRLSLIAAVPNFLIPLFTLF
jgi:hypothetical protein